MNMKRDNILIFSMILVLSLSCQQKNVHNLTDTELMDLATQQGDLISENTQKVLGSKLKEVIQNDGIPQALKYCNVKAFPIVDSLQEVYNAKIRRASHKTRNPDDAPDKMEEKVINEYSNLIINGKTPAAKVVLSGKKVYYYKPIILSASLCLSCHGNIGTDIIDDNYEIIKALYTEDNATGHKMGDLRGIWSITFERDSFHKD
jgi:hypothetical protein